MIRIIAPLIAVVLATCLASASDDNVQTVTTEAEFGDVASGVENAILNRGYKIDYHGFIGDMLKRTAEDVGATKRLYNNAEFFTFCSAVLSRKVMELDLGDIAYCPYVVFVYEPAVEPGKIVVGYRRLPSGGPRDEVNRLLGDIIKDAAEGF